MTKQRPARRACGAGRVCRSIPPPISPKLKARDARRLHQGAAVDIDEAMRRVAGRADPYAPVAGGDQGGQ